MRTNPDTDDIAAYRSYEYDAWGSCTSTSHNANYIIGELNADGGKGYFVLGAYFFNTQIGNLPKTTDFVLSWGLSGYFILGGGFEASININKFLEAWREY